MKKMRAVPLELVFRVRAPVLSAAFYVFLVLVALLVVATPIIALAGASAAEMLLPPFMRQVDGGYTISLGNGIKMFAPSSGVGTDVIKSSIYITFLLWIAYLAVCMPICRFISRLCANVRDGRLLDPKNPLYVKYTGVTVIAGGVLLSILKRYYNFRLVELFAASYGAVSFAVGIDIAPVVIGLIILLFGMIYKVICRERQDDRMPERISEDVNV